MKIAILGAESTGKTRLAAELGRYLREHGETVEVVGEVLREWCEREGRTPQAHEQAGIADEQNRRLREAAGRAGVVVADTTALMTAIYSDLLFGDRSLYARALAERDWFDLTVVTGLDLPWVADGLQRDGPHVREPVDALLRSQLDAARWPYRLVYGQGDARVAAALAALPRPGAPRGSTGTTSTNPAHAVKWRWTCDKCSDPNCERRLFGLPGLADSEDDTR